MRVVTDVSDLYDREVEVICSNDDRIYGTLLLIEHDYVIIRNNQEYQVIFDVRRIVTGG